MIGDFSYLEGRRFCVVFVKVLDVETEKVQLQCMRGRADVERGQVKVVTSSGMVFGIPPTAYPTIQPSDGSPILKDAEYFCFVKTDPNVQIFNPEVDLD